jgi:predicted nuclease of predicted toxin-antitoxin system
MRFVVDAQLPTALARALTARGHLAEHVTDVAPGDTLDGWIWDYALERGAVVVTKDSDFPDLVALREAAPGIVWIRVGNTRKQALLDWFLPQLETVLTLLESGTKVVELR